MNPKRFLSLNLFPLAQAYKEIQTLTSTLSIYQAEISKRSIMPTFLFLKRGKHDVWGPRTAKSCLVAQLCLALHGPMDCSLSGSSVCGILQTRVLEWVAIPFSRGSSLLRDNQESKWKRLKLEDPYLKPHRKQSTNNVLKLKGKS